ncbi:pre-mRNA-splicing factor Cwc26p [[Candida] anglica]|uniref:Pre-mRNA-splicing factor CWC26 n=1 Tax=[Candida] anglica TaxID=148631 RepID=A0ABP0E8X9_9ASCO
MRNSKSSSITHLIRIMSSRADYLAKYLSGGSKKDEKKKRKKKKDQVVEPKPSVVVVDGGTLGGAVEDVSEEEPTDETPVQVDIQGEISAFKGFKRIDGSERVIPVSEPLQESGPESVVVPTKPETVYRDSSGRIIDIQARREQLKAKKLEEEKLELERKQALVETDLSRLQEKELQEKLRNANKFTISKDDVSYNARLQSEARFEDPMSSFQSKSTSKSGDDLFSKTGKPIYTKGISPANRFGISAGHFWDGIDRSNGFEELVMRKRNEVTQQKRVDDYELDLDD